MLQVESIQGAQGRLGIGRIAGTASDEKVKSCRVIPRLARQAGKPISALSELVLQLE